MSAANPSLAMNSTTMNLNKEALDFAPSILAIQTRPASPLPRVMLYTLLMLFVLIVLWAILGKVDVVAVAQGKLVPQSYLKIVQPAEAGIVKEILVKEGDTVAQGQILMRMDAQVQESDTKMVEADLKQRGLQLRRIDAELAGKSLLQKQTDDPVQFQQLLSQYQSHRQAYEDAVAQEQALLAKATEDYQGARQTETKIRNVLPAYQEQEAAWAKLHKDGYAGRLLALERERERIEKEGDLKTQAFAVESLKAGIAQSQKRLAQITSNYKQQLHNERVETQGQLDKLQQEVAKQRHKQTLLELKASQAGKIKDVATHTIGSVVSPGTILLTLVPIDEPLQAEVMINNDDVGFVHEGQSVKVKLAAYPFQKYGMVDGIVTHVSADAADGQGQGKQSQPNQNGTNDQTIGQAGYKAIVTLNAQALQASGTTFNLAPGMQVAAEINQGKRTIMEYLLSPVQGVFQEAARER
jgi:hemolysin D